MMEKPEKLHLFGPIHRFGILMALTFVAVLAVWSIDQSTITDLIEARKYQSRDFQPLNNSQNHNTSSSSTSNNHHSLILQIQPNSPSPSLLNTPQNSSSATTTTQITPQWLTISSQQNYTENLLTQWRGSGRDEPCKELKTVEIKIPNLDSTSPPTTLTTDESHEITFQSLDEFGNPRCTGGDYFELDLSSENWKSRPPITDFKNGTYSFKLQVHRDFHGEYNLTIILLFRHLEGLKFSPNRFGYDKRIRIIPITFTTPNTTTTPNLSLPELQSCKDSDFKLTSWSGRWTRHTRNEDCVISDDGRYRCQPETYPCEGEWCDGKLGLLESNGWVYSAHCRFMLFSIDEAWRCLDQKWLFWWGDSNHVDTIRNLLFFVLGIKELELVTRRFDEKFTNPRNESQWVRITNVFNGHWNVTGNYEGLNSLANEEYREFIRGYFNGATVPDTVVFNSGLHDGVKWRSLRRYVGGAEYAASFWGEVLMGIRDSVRVVFRSTVSTGGYARTLAFNPSKMEVYNGVLLDKMMAKGLVDAVVDDFDLTWAWHFDNRCNDGVHYGRFPAKHMWRDGLIGHQYFVDLMLAHVLLNAVCSA